MNKSILRRQIRRSLKEQGFRFAGTEIVIPREITKNGLRKLHDTAVRHKIERAERGLRRLEDRLLGCIANSGEVIADQIRPALVEVRANSEHELLFRYAALHWNIPVSSGYGRRLRYLVVDRSNDKLIGIIGLNDPVFALGPRDNWIGWNREQRRDRLQNVLDAFILGAVPPYNSLLCGKLVAMLAMSNEVRERFWRKYHGKTSFISGKENDGRVALITTLSALGRSSVYNRLAYNGRLLLRSVGFSQGSGEFQFSNGLYSSIFAYTKRYCTATAKNSDWGSGFRNKREVIRKCLQKIELSSALNYHGIQREVFLAPLARNAREFLRGEHSKLLWYDLPATDLVDWFRRRWLLPRSMRPEGRAEFFREQYRIWKRDE